MSNTYKLVAYTRLGETMKLSELQSKRVICVVSGKELGFISDAILNANLQMICIIVCMPRRGIARLCPFLFTQQCEKMSVECIVNIGEDVILVKREKN